MNAQQLEKTLTDYTLTISKFDERRDYISLSNIVKEPEELIYAYKNGYVTDTKGKLKCYKGYQMEEDLKQRIIDVIGSDVKTDVEFSTPDGLFKCHPDLMIDDYPADCKSVLKDEWLPEDYFKVSRKIKYQMNAQMLLSVRTKSYLIYESRESGLIKVIEVYADEHIQYDIKNKMNVIRQLLKSNS